MRLFRIVLTLLCVASVSVALGANWPRFRGPNGTGTAADKDIPTEFSDSKNVLWKVEIPGTGNSSPVVWDDRVFLQTASPDGKERLLLCLDLKDGKTLWSKGIAGVPKNQVPAGSKLHNKNTLASSTPATDGKSVYAIFWDGREMFLCAYDFAGKELWKADLGPFTGQHGVGCSPIIVGDKVVINNDQDGTAKLVGVDTKDGKIAWETPRKAFRTCHSTPFVLEQNGTTRVIVSSTAGLAGYDPSNGKEMWAYTWKFSNKSLRTVGSPIYTQGILVAASGDGSGDRHTIAVRLEDKGDAATTNLLWQSEDGKMPYVPTFLANGDYLYFVDDKVGTAVCLEAKTGKVVWEKEKLVGTTTASPVLIDGKVYAVSEKGDVHVFAADPTFKEIATNSLREGVMASPAVANGRLLIRGSSHLFCIGKK